jgi:hypothetical protein
MKKVQRRTTPARLGFAGRGNVKMIEVYPNGKRVGSLKVDEIATVGATMTAANAVRLAARLLAMAEVAEGLPINLVLYRAQRTAALVG